MMYRPPMKAFTFFLSHYRHQPVHNNILLPLWHQHNIAAVHKTARISRDKQMNNCGLRLSSSSNNDHYSLDLCIPTPDDMEDIGGLLSVNSNKGDVILLDGDLGAGKTCFSRGFIRGRTGLEDERVTSPTYLLSNTYAVDGGSTKIYHMDLYRLSGAEEDDDLAPLDLENALTNGICLIEWPSRLSEKPTTRLDITLTIDSTIYDADSDEDGDDDDSKSRRMRLEAYGDRWEKRLKFLETEGYFEGLIIES